MRTVIAGIIKLLAWALFIITALLYMENLDVRSKAAVLLCGVVAIDIVVGGAKQIAHLGAKRKKRRMEKRMKEQSEALKQAAAEKAAAAAEAVKSTGAAVREGAADAAGNLWGSLRRIGASIKSSLAAVDEADSEALPMLGDGSHKGSGGEEE